MPNEMDLSIVIPNHNRCKELELTLGSLCQQTYPAEQFEVMVVDQASSDGSRELVKSLQTPFQLRILEQEQKYGISVGRNAGCEAAQSGLVLILDADIIPESGVVEAHIRCHERHPNALICGRVLPYPAAYRTFVEKCANPEAGLDRSDKEIALPYHQAFGGHISLERSVFQEVGDFAPDLKGFEDIEFAYRAHKLGRQSWNCPQAVSYHNHPRTLDERLEQCRRYQRMLPIFLERFPEIRGSVKDFLPYEPIEWRSDPISVISRKLQYQLAATGFARWILRRTVDWLERTHFSKTLARGCYWQLYFAYSFLGFQEGNH